MQENIKGHNEQTRASLAMSQSIDLNEIFLHSDFISKFEQNWKLQSPNTLNISIAFATPFNISHFINAIYQVLSTLNCLSSRCY